MKVKKVEETDKKLTVEMEGEDYSMANLLVDESFESGADAAFMRQQHPMVASPSVTVSGSNPKKILSGAAKNVEKLAKEFQSKFK